MYGGIESAYRPLVGKPAGRRSLERRRRRWEDDITRQAMYAKRHIEARSRNHCCRGTAVSVTYLCVCVCVWVYGRWRVFARV